ncbi:2'-5'-oligoadenylate synthase 1-like [Terrapene carolina triunguis]|uniref:2'-5'-oligoadenylate synthase 1-like n=1 Tax=Terrapene triunguis TaxID=2587831 RepID=UPI000E77AC6F|nr:2'-5'-oligoadenylate synthase 1-like [Terrapene carolina triunguis]
MELYQVPAGSLDAWIAEHLQPSEEFQLQVKDTVRRICDFLKETCFDDIKVFKTVKGGSAGKGTALKNNSDADLVLFLSCFSSYRDLMENRAAVLDTVKQKLNRCQQTIAFSVDVEVFQPKKKGTCPRSLSITIQSKKRWESIEVDVLPAYDALGQVTPGSKPSPQVYEDLIQAGAGPGEFCTSFTELQRDFVKRRPAKLKNLLRLVKHWYKEISKTTSGLPPKYALELLTIYAWETGTKGAENFSTSEGFRTVMELLCRYQELCVYWTEFYDFQSSVIGTHVKRLLREPCPVILDPADPTGTLGQGKSWALLAREAAVCRNQLCCRNGLAPIRCWDVQPARPMQVMVKQLSGVSLALRLSPYTTIWEIKEELERAWGISPYTQRLALQEPGLGNQLLLDDQTLASHGIFYDTTVLMLTTEPQEMEIFVKDHNSRTIPYGVRASDTVLGLKKMIEDRTGVSASQQRLTFNSKELQDDYTLSHYRIRSKSTVYLLLRLRGG